MLYNDGIKMFYFSFNLSLHHIDDILLIYVPNFDYLNLDNFSPPLAEMSFLLRLTILSREIYFHASISFILRNDVAHFTIYSVFPGVHIYDFNKMHKEDGIFLMAVQMNQNYFRCIICVYYLVSSTERSNVLLYNYFVSFILLFLYRYNQRCICKLTFFSVSTYDWTKPSSLCVNKILNHFQSSLCNLVLTILTFFSLVVYWPQTEHAQTWEL